MNDSAYLFADISVLVIEDSAGYRRVVSAILLNMGFRRAHEAADLEHAMVMLGSDARDCGLILLDVHLPDGLATESRLPLWALAKARGIPVVVMTADESPEILQQAFSSGAADFMAKPLSSPVMRARLGGVLQQQVLVEKVLQHRRHVDHLLEVFREGLIQVDGDGCVVHANESARRLLGAAWPMTRKHYSRILPGEKLVEALDAIIQNVAETGVAEGRVRVPSAGGRPRLLSVRAVHIPDEGHSFGVLLSLRDVTRDYRERRQLLQLAFTDPLTGLPNRKLLGDRIRHAILRAKRTGRRFALIYLDVDNFKPVNDRFGHRAGDTVLAGFAQHLQASVRQSDTVARVGGDEFVVLIDELQESSDVDAQLARVTRAMNWTTTVGDEDWLLTASLGGAIFPDDGEDEEVLMQLADQRMYADKQGGPADD